MKEKFFAFVEDAKKKKDLSLLTNAFKRKAEETKQDMTKLEETVSLKKKQKKYLSYLGTFVWMFYIYTDFIDICVWCQSHPYRW